jgi:TPR repeat protein
LLRGAELGSAKSYGQLAVAYIKGHGVQKDDKKTRHFRELAAIGGDVRSRSQLALLEVKAGNVDKGIKHAKIAASFGHAGDLNNIKVCFLRLGPATRDDYEQALHSYQQYLEEVKSDQRDMAAAFYDKYKYLIHEQE